MKYSTKLLLATVAIPLFAVSLAAQTTQAVDSSTKTETAKAKPDSTKEPASAKKISGVPAIEFQHLRPADSRGLNVFEPPKNDSIPYTGFKLGWGAAMTQQFQGLRHSNTAAPVYATGSTVNQNQLITIGNGFNNAVANIYLNAQVARGIRLAMTSYASARHHQESWIKDGYALIDESPIDNPILNGIMKYTTLRVGHFEIDYGDAHYRRSDNGQAMYNPFVGNYILDAFTTEIGGEVYLRNGPWLAMGGITGGEVHGQVTTPTRRSESYLAKLGVDKEWSKNLRFRLMGSMYANGQSASNTLFTGDRAGSRYYDVLENTTSTETTNAWSGAIRPGFGNNVHAFVVNPFVKVAGVELFGNLETATGKGASELTNRTVRQYVGEGLYRFANDQLYVGARYNTVKGELAGITNDISVNRWQYGGGWFVTPLLLAKVEYVNQKYLDFPVTDIRNGGQFKGFMVEGVLAF
ncbi:MAG TPA: hypothetical protein VJN70_21125 [Gemmatimonadaceae bacterium]|nr:hypothetical protein [Gemmatimonadaceae bacterium]